MIESNCDNNIKDFKMCDKLKEVNGLTAEEILNKYWSADRNIYPIDIATILFRMGIRVCPYDFSKFNESDSQKKILGAMVANKKDIAFLYRQGESLNRNRFTLAHELAHCCLAHLDEKTIPYVEYRHDGIVTDKCEIDANIFAGELLIPTKELRTILSNEYPNALPKITRLADAFAVSINVMAERLKYLKLPYIDECNRKIYCVE